MLLFLVVRAIFRQRRYRVASSFTEDDRRAVREAVAAAERRTVGEILPVVVERSDPHPGADWLAALCCLLVGTSLLAGWLPWEQPVFLVLSQFGMAAVGFGLARILPGFKRVFIFEDRAALLHGPEQIADLPVPVAESPGAVRIGHPERSHLVEYLAPNSVFNSLPRQRSSPHLRPDDRLVTIDRVLHHASLGVA